MCKDARTSGELVSYTFTFHVHGLGCQKSEFVADGFKVMSDTAIILETKRLYFRRLVMGDLDDLFSLYSDPEVRLYFPEGTLSYGETKEELEWFLDGHPQHPELGLWATVLKESGLFIGRCGLLPWIINGHDEVEIAYMIDKSLWEQGFGTEAAQAIRDYAFEQLGLTRLICLIDEHNQASIRVAQKIGMTFEKEGIDDLGPLLLYTMGRNKNS